MTVNFKLYVLGGEDGGEHIQVINAMKARHNGNKEEYASHIDAICLEIAQELNSVYDREGDILYFRFGLAKNMTEERWKATLSEARGLLLKEESKAG